MPVTKKAPIVLLAAFQIIEGMTFTDGSFYERVEHSDQWGHEINWYQEGYAGVHDFIIPDDFAEKLEKYYNKTKQGWNNYLGKKR